MSLFHKICHAISAIWENRKVWKEWETEEMPLIQGPASHPFCLPSGKCAL
jgi:hypothetical protein